VNSEIPEVVVRLVATCISSIAQLEALLLLRERSVPLTADAVARALYCQPVAVERYLTGLKLAGLLDRLSDPPDHFVYRPCSPELAQHVDMLAQAYHERRVALTTLIYSDSTYAMRSFADAFRIRKEN
jgi:hypothetical protein